MESARRASEIHKRRTGRSLRVTEQDVVNEEMYEEEDDDLPMQYRRLTAHLQTGSADFNRRLSAYLTNHVAMRSALDQAITNSYAQQYPNAPQFAHNHSMYPSPFMPQTMPQTYSQPYPSPGTPGYRPSHPSRSASVSHAPTSFSPSEIPKSSPTQSLPQLDHRRTSASSKSSSNSPHGAPATPNSLQTRPGLPQTSTVYKIKQENPVSQQMRAPPTHSPTQQQQPPFNMAGYPGISPFSTSLPPESQMLLGSSLDPNDPLTSIFMAGSENLPQPYNYNMPSPQKQQSFRQGHGGMSATLAPSALDMSPSAMPNPPPAPAFPGYDGSMPDFAKGQLFPGYSSLGGSGNVTPGGIDSGWDAFINDSSWEQHAT